MSDTRRLAASIWERDALPAWDGRLVIRGLGGAGSGGGLGQTTSIVSGGPPENPLLPDSLSAL